MPEPDARPVTMNFRTSEELSEEIRKAAAEDNRTLSNWLETVVRREIERRQETQKGRPV
jgi:predicted HicB family RNase H-like nuclease